MKISLAWLNTYLDRPVTADQVAHALTDLGFPVETRQDLPGGDVMLDAEITSNRPDCLSHLGLAHEVAAALGLMVKPPAVSLPPSPDAADAASLTSVTIEAPALCPVYTARVIRGVKVGPSPAWLVGRLEALGLRSVNNVVDVTNFVLLEMGQPLHAFDMNRLAERRIVVRAAREAEPFVAIDGSKHALRSGMLVIADARAPVAVAGVMGGLDSEVGPATTEVLLESALFAPLSIRQTSRALKLSSDASYRFERGIDPAGVERASRRAAALIVELAGGTLAAGVVRAGQDEPSPRTLTMRVARCREVLGVDLDAQAMLGLLARLNLSPRLAADKASVTCTVPTYRLDLKEEIDLVEEVGRLAGYGGLAVHEKMAVVVRPVQRDVAALRELRRVLTGHGYFETVTFSFVPPAQGKLFVPASQQAVMIDDERRKKEPMLRPSVLPSLLVCRKANQDVGNAAVRIFETAATWRRMDGQLVETRRLGLLADVDPAAAAQGLRELRGLIGELVGRLLHAPADFEPMSHPCLEAAAAIKVGGRSLGVCGLASADVRRRFELAGAVMLAELDIAPLLEAYPPARQVQPLSRFPAIERDLSVVVDDVTPWARIQDAILADPPALMEALHFVTTYRGKPVAPGRKSVTFRMVFRDPSATLRHEQVDGQVQTIVDRLAKSLGAQLRQ